MASILKSSVIVSSLTMGSRIFGFLRDVVIANKLGVSAASDAFFVALLVPNILRRIFAEGAFNVVFVPILSRMKETSPKDEEDFINSAYMWLLFVVGFVVILGEIFMPQLISYVIAPGWSSNNPEKLELVVPLARITFPYLLLITLASFAGGICNTHKKFGPFAFVPVLLNFAIIGCLFFLPPFGIDPSVAASIALPIGGVMQMGYMWWALHKINIRPMLTEKIKHPEMKPMLMRMGPAALTMGILQISFLIDIQFASFIADDAVSYMQYANRFYQFPLALIAVTLSTVLLPHFSTALAKNDTSEANKSFTSAITYGGMLSLASMAGLLFLADVLISTLFGHGKFTEANALATATTMQAYCIGLPALVVAKVSATAFYANKDTKTPVLISIFSLVVNVALNFILIREYAYVGLALATGLTAYFNAGMQIFFLYRKDYMRFEGLDLLMANMGKTIVITLFMVAWLFAFKEIVPLADNFILKMVWLVGACISAAIVFITAAHVSKLFDVKEVISHIRN